jgi:hypothetical protein
MTQQEIKANMTQGTWVVDPAGWDSHDFGVSDSEKYSGGRFVIGGTNSNFERTTFDTKAIVSAINNTYGKGINPESVPDMFNALQTIDEILHAETMGEVTKIIRDILKNATL